MGFWDEVQGEQPPKTCGNCLKCDTYRDERGHIYDPFCEVKGHDKEMWERLVERYGMCRMEGYDHYPVFLDEPTDSALCGGDGYERRYA